MTDFLCPYCKTDFPADFKIFHVFPCGREYMLKHKMLPLCTCNRCKGTRSHPGDQLDGSFGEEEEVPLAKREKEKPIHPKMEPVTAISTTPSEPPRPVLSEASTHAHQHTGGNCIVCDTKKSPSAVRTPFIYLGRFMEFMVCKKEHLHIDDEYELLTKRLTTAWKLIETNGTDEPNPALRDSADAGEVTFAQNHKCEGYTTQTGETVCGKLCKIELYFDLDNPRYFCKVTHLLRYLALHYGKQGKNCFDNRHKSESGVKKRKRNKAKSDKKEAVSNAGAKK
jgi:hypothetical protein